MPYLYRIYDKLRDIILSFVSVFDRSPFGPATQKYWVNRYQLFSKFDKGIQLDAEGLYSATPEAIAFKIATKIASPTVVDAFCGLGISSIAFAKTGHKVIAMDKNSTRLEKAKTNAAIYGAKDIKFIAGDFFEEVFSIKADCVYLDPPWGGPEYNSLSSFGLENFSVSGTKLLKLALQHFSSVVLLVPKNFNLSELNQFGRKFEKADNYIFSKLFSKTVYFI